MRKNPGRRLKDSEKDVKCSYCGVSYQLHGDMEETCKELQRVRLELLKRLEAERDSALNTARLLAGFAWDDEVEKIFRQRAAKKIDEILG